MRTTFVIPLTLFASSVIAHPHGAGHPHAIGHNHHHAKRETNQYIDEDGNVVIEDIVWKTVTVPYGGAAPTSSKAPKSTHAAQKKLVQPQPRPHRYTWSPPEVPVQPSSTKKPVETPAPIETPAPVETPAPIETPPAPTSEAPPPSKPAGGNEGQAVGTGPVPGPSNINVAGSDTWATSPNSVGKSILATANYWRKKFDSDLDNFEWDETLAGNARQTALGSEQGANVMEHTLNEGSMGQCINQGDGESLNGDLTPFENAWLGWMCERPTADLPCDQIGEAGHYAVDEKTGKPETGHADIIAGDYKKIGCYYQDATQHHDNFKGMWTCDFA